jgi:hypothetical protein
MNLFRITLAFVAAMLINVGEFEKLKKNQHARILHLDPMRCRFSRLPIWRTLAHPAFEIHLHDLLEQKFPFSTLSRYRIRERRWPRSFRAVSFDEWQRTQSFPFRYSRSNFDKGARRLSEKTFLKIGQWSASRRTISPVRGFQHQTEAFAPA